MRILVADDDATSRLVLEAVVTKLGHECLVASDGSHAWEVLTEHEIDVLLTDWMMPGLDGPELCRRVREELRHYTYVVLITGLANPQQVLEGMRAGADDYLIKPVDPFSVQTSMVAAERVIILHRQLADFRTQLEQTNLELLELSRVDALTGLGNRRRMEEDLARAHARALRSGRSYCLALFDIDYFKLYNDHYGHPAGDETLRGVARCLERSARSNESVYRYGGEEFLLLMPECALAEAAVAAEGVRQAVLDMAAPHDARPTDPAFVTLSGGVHCWTPTSELSMPEALAQSDRALFVAKSSGRNRIHTVDHEHLSITDLAPVSNGTS
jgi:two-component system, cell cycle response regulator